MKNFMRISAALAFTIVMASACQKESSENSLPTPHIEAVYDYENFKLPVGPFGFSLEPNFFVSENFHNPVNPLTNEGATLGRVLFYDGHLSKNNLISCGSCHIQSKGFADPAQFSTGFKLGHTTRNSMALSNLCMQNSYFWDLRESKLEEQVMAPVQNHIEMGIEEPSVLPKKLGRLSYYAPLFEDAFGDAEITEERISFALASFLRSMVSSNSRYDQAAANDFQDFTELEEMGRQLFTSWDSRAGCANCHSNVLFDGWSPENIGLDATPSDAGFRDGAFKVPSLRNVAVTAPYMHDGRFQTLEEVINHYDHGVNMNPGLSWALRDDFGNDPKRLNLTDVEKKALVAFLKTLTDEEYLRDPKFSDPFK